MPDEIYDVAVVGAGPAGATAAILLSQKERSVVLVDGDTFPRSTTASTWISPKTIPLLEEIGVDTDRLPTEPFLDVTFFDASFGKTAKPTFTVPAGYLIDRGSLDNALVEAAGAAGVTMVQGCAVTDVRLAESTITLTVKDHQPIDGKLLVLATGTGSPLLGRCGFPPGLGDAPLWTAQLDVPLDAGDANQPPRVAVVLGLNRGSSFGFICVTKDCLSLSIHWCGKPLEAVSAFVQLCKSAFEHGVAGVDLSKQAAAAKPVISPAGAALDLDSHVGKHTLLIGSAGGFVSAAGNEGIYPAMWSAQIAARVAKSSLSSTFSQDELMTFDSQWRMEMANYLRPPNTDSQFLLPLVFSNQAMADRMGGAFFWGENI